MAGTREGGLKAAATNKKRYGDGSNGKESFYKTIGRKGGTISRGGGWTGDTARAKEMGSLGGKAGKRGVSKKSSEETAAEERARAIRQHEAEVRLTGYRRVAERITRAAESVGIISRSDSK